MLDDYRLFSNEFLFLMILLPVYARLLSFIKTFVMKVIIKGNPITEYGLIGRNEFLR